MFCICLFLDRSAAHENPSSTAASPAVSGMKDIEFGWPTLLPHLLLVGNLFH